MRAAALLALAAVLMAVPAAAAGEPGPCSDAPVVICPVGPCEKPCCYALWVLGIRLIDPLFCAV